MGFLVLPIILAIPFLFVIVNFTAYLVKGKTLTKKRIWQPVALFIFAGFPFLFFMFFDWGLENSCCTDSPAFAPENKFGIYTLIIICIMAYAFSSFRVAIFAPIPELLLNTLLILGLVINGIMMFHIKPVELGGLMILIGNSPLILLLILQLHKNHLLLIEHNYKNKVAPIKLLDRICFKVLHLKPLIKYPVLIVLLVPLLIVFSLLLFLFGQKPDTLIRAFTDTYKHGFSQLDYLCDNVNCGGHFLCSVGALGNKKIVKPIRLGERNNEKIICNRQLLISNAFEEILHKKLPKAHYFLRKNYNKVGAKIHKHYYLFNNSNISNIVYILMKPLEWIFLFTLYCVDKNPENRIAMQYLNPKDRQKIKNSYSPQTCSKTQI
ncbi:hypothetical protein LG651_00695 [Tamlana sp. 62-3]|uniref:Uncharacterized protein n=1 Tax=Neotamlana sargassicola TaxID=2883125 RepID=A0A9X1L381_9FLAO|nr:DUF6688 family protein [Tamlana sargassicola]MCB4806750.1 hypothetical protein [Tamlana sargassicola]